MKIGLMWKSEKENEKRYPLHWQHLTELSNDEIDKLYFEKGYSGLEKVSTIKSSHILNRKDLFSNCDMIILPKPMEKDFSKLCEDQILWGWSHAVQNPRITQIAIDKKLSLLAWESMYTWKNSCKKDHIFSRNNELAGYSAVNHMMSLYGITPGVYGEDKKIAVLGYGSTSRGALNALIGMGATDITVFSKRNKFQIDDAITNIKFKTYSKIENHALIDNKLAHHELNNYDIIINCVLQDPLEPIMFLNENDISIQKQKLIVIDVSCDYEMAFDFAKPTSFSNPTIETDKYIYYGVDHTPMYYWESASYELSGAILPYLKYILKNDTIIGNITLEKALDIDKGNILNNDILNFQNREHTSPYIIKHN